MAMASEHGEIVFFDVETTLPLPDQQGCALLEFGAILICRRTLVELCCFSTLVKPASLSSIPYDFLRSKGLSREAISAAPTFQDVAHKIYDILHGRIWAGHNIIEFDCVQIYQAFAKIDHPAPEPRGTIDTLTLLKERFGRRAGDMKMATLAYYFGLGRQRHRSLDDARMNIEVLKHCATVLFLESNPGNLFQANTVTDQMTVDHILQDANADERVAGYLDADDVNISSLRASLVPAFPHQGGLKTVLLYGDYLLQLCCMSMIVPFGVSVCNLFRDRAGRPKLSIVVDTPPSLCRVLNTCENLAKQCLQESGSSSVWRPLENSTIRLNMPTISNGRDSTEIYQKKPSGSMQRLIFSHIDTDGLKLLISPRTVVDAYFSVELYDYEQNAGIRFVAKRLNVHSRKTRKLNSFELPCVEIYLEF